MSITDELSRYERQEKRTYVRGLKEARIASMAEDAATHYNDPQKLAEYKAGIQSTINSMANDELQA